MTLPPLEESQLAAYILYMADRGLPVGRKEVKLLARQMDRTHKNPSFGTNGPSDGWLEGFRYMC